MKIFIDSGHNFSGCDTGAAANGLYEQNVTFEIAKKLKELLLKGGHEVKMSRNYLEENIGRSTSESLKKRCEMSNSWGADLFCSIHANAGGGKGTETYVYSQNSKAYDVAKRVQKAIVKKLKTADRGVKVNNSLAVIRGTKAPAILVETAFIDNKEDAKKLRDNTYDFAMAIYEGITEKPADKDVTEVLDIVYELAKRGIITNEKLWVEKLKEDSNSYWLVRKCAEYMIERNV